MSADQVTSPDPRWPHRGDPGTPVEELLIRARREGQSRTRSGRFNGYNILAVTVPDDFPPDCNYWSRNARSVKFALIELLGVNSYQVWADRVWPDDELDRFTWRTIYDMTEAALGRFENGERSLESLAAAARGKLEELQRDQVATGEPVYVDLD